MWGPLTPNSGSDLKPKATENATERETEGGGFCHHKWKQERIRTELLATTCKASGQSEISWLISSPREAGSCCGNSNMNAVTAGWHESCGWPLRGRVAFQ